MMRLVSTLLLILFFAAPVLPSFAGEDEEPDVSKPSRWPGEAPESYMWENGGKLVYAGDWANAAEVYAGNYRRLEEAAGRAVWAAENGRTPEEANRYRYELAHWFVENSYPRGGTVTTAYYARTIACDYDRWRRSVPAGERRRPFDFSHLDLLDWVSERWEGDGPELGPADEARILGALRLNPEALAAISAFELLIFWLEDSRASACLQEADGIMSTSFGRLVLARIAAHPAWKEKHREIRIRILSAGWDEAPSPGEKAYLLDALGHLEAGRRDTEEEREQLLLAAHHEVERRFPRSSAASVARRDIIRGVTVLCGRDAALAELRRFQEMGDAHRDGLPTALLTLADAYRRAGDSATADRLVLDVIERYPDTVHIAATAMERAADIAEEAGDLSEAASWLEKVVDRTPWNTERMRRLAGIYETLDLWEDALRAYEKWKPSKYEWRDEGLAHVRAMARCALRAQGPAEMVRVYATRLGWYSSNACCFFRDYAADLFRIYHDSGQLDDLKDILDAVEEHRAALIAEGARGSQFLDEPIHPLRELLALHVASKKGDVAMLVNTLKDRHRPTPKWPEERQHSWIGDVVADMLGRQGGEEVEPVRKAAIDADKKRGWFILALGKSQSLAAVDALEDLSMLSAEEKDHAWIAEALLLHGDAGRERLTEIARRGGLAGEAAKRILRDGPAKPEPRYDNSAIPKALPGSLPRSVILPRQWDG